MKTQAGVGIDHRNAFVVFVDDDAENTQPIESGMEKHVRYFGHSAPQEGSPNDPRDRHYTVHLDRYYDEVIAHIRDVACILIFGPGEARGELEKGLKGKGLGERFVGVETVDKMTDRQVAAKLREHFGQ